MVPDLEVLFQGEADTIDEGEFYLCGDAEPIDAAAPVLPGMVVSRIIP